MLPGEAYRHLQAYGLIGVSEVAQSQVYYQWKRLTTQLWNRDPDPIQSSIALLNEQTEDYRHMLFTDANLCGIAICIKASIARLQSAQELAIDATYGTNNSALGLYAVLAEHDGTGVPLAYLFIGSVNDTPPVNSAAGATTNIIQQFLRGLQSVNCHLDPSFFGCDKDTCEINAIRQVYPYVTIQLCYWHAKRAIRQKLQSAGRTKTQANIGLEKLFLSFQVLKFSGDPRLRCDLKDCTSKARVAASPSHHLPWLLLAGMKPTVPPSEIRSWISLAGTTICIQ